MLSGNYPCPNIQEPLMWRNVGTESSLHAGSPRQHSIFRSIESRPNVRYLGLTFFALLPGAEPRTAEFADSRRPVTIWRSCETLIQLRSVSIQDLSELAQQIHDQQRCVSYLKRAPRAYLIRLGIHFRARRLLVPVPNCHWSGNQANNCRI